MKDVRLRMTEPAWHSLCKHLLRDDGCEHLAFLPVRLRANHDELDLLATEVWTVADEQLVGGAMAESLEPSPEVLLEIVNRAVLAGCGLVEVHNHPLSWDLPRFSLADELGFDQVVPYMLESLRLPIYGALVLGDEQSIDGTVWERTPNDRTTIKKIEVLSSVRKIVATTSCPLRTQVHQSSNSMHDRQVRAIGAVGQAAIRDLTVAVVGLGGIGSIVVQQLAHLGVQKFVLVDPDLVEQTNLNRLVGATCEDVKRGMSKVDVAARLIRSLYEGAKVESLSVPVFASEAIDAVASADLIVTGTDDHASRFAVNEISLAYLRPLLDLGTEIHARSGRIESIGGRMTFLLPGTGCLLCARAIDPFKASAELRPPQAARFDLERGYINGDEEPAPSVLPLNGTTVSLAIMEILAWATGWRKASTQKFYDGLDGTVCDVQFDRLDDCVACSELTGCGDAANLKEKYRAWAGVPTGV